jgi:hypothetical protein
MWLEDCLSPEHKPVECNFSKINVPWGYRRLQTDGYGAQNNTIVSSTQTSINLFNNVLFKGGHAVAYWLRHYAASRKVAGSRPDEVDFF